MNAIVIGAIVLACVFGGAVIGMALRSLLPSGHFEDSTKYTVQLSIGIVATMASLVLGLLVSSAKSSFDKTSDELTQTAARIVHLDHVLAQYGPEAKEIRASLRQQYKTVVDALLSQDKSSLALLRAPRAGGRLAGFQAGLRALVPSSEDQRQLRSQALALGEEVNANRTMLLLYQHDSISRPLLVVVVSWFTLIFVGFGLFCPRNLTSVSALFLCALSVAGAIFLIVEMDGPLEGMIRISEVPMRSALGILTGD